jgi:hypothetical protein
MVCGHLVHQCERCKSAESRINPLHGTPRRYCGVGETRDWSRHSKSKIPDLRNTPTSISGKALTDIGAHDVRLPRKAPFPGTGLANVVTAANSETSVPTRANPSAEPQRLASTKPFGLSSAPALANPSVNVQRLASAKLIALILFVHVRSNSLTCIMVNIY